MKRLVLLANILIGGFALNAQTLNDGLKSLDFENLNKLEIFLNQLSKKNLPMARLTTT